MTHTVSAVIATIGRPSLSRAVQSVLDQSLPVTEVIVVMGADAPGPTQSDDRITVLRASGGSGASRSRQLGIDAARGSVVALLDDDDEWLRNKLERQLAAVRECSEPMWIASSRTMVVGPGSRRRTWPRRLIAPDQSIADYLFKVSEIGVGGALLQTSTLLFPTDLARRVRWDEHPEAVHDEPTWLIDVQQRIPNVRLVHLPDVLSVYDVAGASVSRDRRDRTDEYIAWGLQHLRAESPRLRGDYLCTSPVSAAVTARSLSGVRRSVGSALRHGRPGPAASAYAALSAARIVSSRLVAAVRR